MLELGDEWILNIRPIRLGEVTTPANAEVPANVLSLFAKDQAGISALFYKNDAGAEINLSGGLTGTGVNGRLTLWSGASTFSSDPGLLYVGGTNPSLRVLSNSATDFAQIELGRTATDLRLGVAGQVAHFSDISLQGDSIVRADTLNLILTARNATGNIKFATGAADIERARIGSDGDMIIGSTVVPTAGFVGRGVGVVKNNFSEAGIYSFNAIAGLNSGLRLYAAGGTIAAPTGTQIGHGGFISLVGRDNVGNNITGSRALIELAAAETWSSSAQGAYISLKTTSIGTVSLAERFRAGPAGQWGIGGATYGTAGNLFQSGGASAAPSWLDHTTDFLSQYALLAGRAGGQQLALGTQTTPTSDLHINRTATQAISGETALLKVQASGIRTCASSVFYIGADISSSVTDTGSVGAVRPLGLKVDATSATESSIGAIIMPNGFLATDAGLGIGGTPDTQVALQVITSFTRAWVMNNTTIGTTKTHGTYMNVGTDGSFTIFNQEALGSSFIKFGVSDGNMTVTQRGNVSINAPGAPIEPGTGSLGLFFQDGTASSSMAANTAGVYADSMGANVEPMSIDESNRVRSLAWPRDVRVSTQFNKTSDTTLANVTNLTHDVNAGKTYSFEARLFTTSVNTGGVKAAIGGTATATSIIYEGRTIDAGVTTQSRATALGTAVGAVTAVTAALIIIKGTIVVNAAGTLTVQFAQNASDVTASSVLVNSSFVVDQMP